MVNVSAEAAASAHPTGQELKLFAKLKQRIHRKNNTPINKAPDVQMKANEFVVKTGTGSEQNRKGKRGEGTESGFATFSGETIKQYTTFLDNFVTNISRELGKNPTMLSQPGFERVARLMEILTVNGAPSSDKISTFLSSSQGLSLANQIMDEQTAVQLMALGWDANIRYGKDTQSIHTSTLFNLGKSGIKRDGFGREMHYIGVNTLGAKDGLGGAGIGAGIGMGVGYALDHVALADATSFVRAIGAGLSSGTVSGTIIGAGIGGVIGHKFFSPNGDVDLSACADALAAIKADPNRVAYIKAISGIDANDFVVNGNNVGFDPARAIHETPNIETRINEIGQTLQTRRAFFESLGAPHMRRGEAMEQLFTRYNDEGRAQTMTVWSQRIQERLDPNGAAYQAMNAQQRRERFLEVQQEVMGEYIEDYFLTVFTGDKLDVGAVSSMEAKVTKGKDQQEWITKQNAKKLQLEADKTYLSDEQKSIFGDKDSEDRNFAKIKEQQAKIEAEYKLEFKDEATAATPLTFEEAIQKRFDLLKKTGKGSIRAMRKAALKALETVETANPPVTKTSVITQATGAATTVTESIDHPTVVHARQRYADEIAQITALESNLNAEVTALRALMTRRNAADASLAVLRAGSEGYAGFVESSQRAFAELTRSGILTQTELANLTFDELYQRINDFHKANPTSSTTWAELDNGNDVHRQKLLQAVVEAKAAEQSLSVNVGNENSLYQLITFQGLTESELLKNATTPDEILTKINGINAADPTKGWPVALNPTMQPMILGAIAAAQLRSDFRNQAFDVVIQNADISSKLADATKTLFKENPEVGRVEIAIDAAKRQSDILSASTDVSRNFQEFFSAAPVQPADNLTNEERAILTVTTPGGPVTTYIPEGYYNMLNFMFDYRNKGAERGSYFAKIQSMINPDQLAAIAEDVFHFGLVPGAVVPTGVLNIENVMVEIQMRMDDRQFGQRELRRLSMRVINDLILRGNAISL